jgi:cytochrome P450
LRGIQLLRQTALSSLLGSGISTIDGSSWQHSRSILRPQFEESQVSALVQFEPYVHELFYCTPTDDSIVDLQDLFPELTMNTSSDMFTGSGTGFWVVIWKGRSS